MNREENTKRKRKSTRVVNYDYSKGAFYVTLCSHHKQCLFGHVADGKMHLSAIGAIVKDCLVGLDQQFANVKLDEFAVLPNHLHAIFILGENNQKPLGQLIGALKSQVSRRVRQELGLPATTTIWQQNFYERIVRSEYMLKKNREYIAKNVVDWEAQGNEFREWRTREMGS